MESVTHQTPFVTDSSGIKPIAVGSSSTPAVILAAEGRTQENRFVQQVSNTKIDAGAVPPLVNTTTSVLECKPLDNRIVMRLDVYGRIVAIVQDLKLILENTTLWEVASTVEQALNTLFTNSPIQIRDLNTVSNYLTAFETGTLSNELKACKTVTNHLLLKAISYKYEAVVKGLLNTGVDINAVNKCGLNALMISSGDGACSMMQLLLDTGALIEGPSDAWCTPLTYAVMRNQVDAVKLLVEHKASVKAKGRYGETVLMCALQSSQAIITLLIENGADVNAQNNFGMTALMKATWLNDTAVIQLLLAGKARIDATDTVGWTPLMHAVLKKNRAAIELLVHSGANKYAQDTQGMTALRLARTHSAGSVFLQTIESLLA